LVPFHLDVYQETSLAAIVQVCSTQLKSFQEKEILLSLLFVHFAQVPQASQEYCQPGEYVPISHSVQKFHHFVQLKLYI
jgi:hypothetical protein